MELKLVKKCETCGANVTVADDKFSAACQYCGSSYTYSAPLNAETEININRATNYRLKNYFDDAIVEYTTLLQNDNYKQNSEVYWGRLLSKYGIEYVHDTRSDIYLPTCHRTLKTPVFQDSDYTNALKYATDEMRVKYAEKAREIADIQEQILLQFEKAEAFDVFICFKSTDNKAPTEDRFIARKVYDELIKRGINVFFSEVTLKGKLGAEYEPVIFKALMTSKIMLLICTNECFLDAPFVKNEWSRFKDRMRSDSALSIIPVFKNVNHALLPTKNQGVDLSKYPVGGYEIDIADNLEKLVGKRPDPVKVTNEVLAQYEMYNKANQNKFAREYEEALRPAKTSKEYKQKASEMKNLGSFRDADIKAAEYGAEAEKCLKTEIIEHSKIKKYSVIRIIILTFCILTTALAITFSCPAFPRAKIMDTNAVVIYLPISIIFSAFILTVFVFSIINYYYNKKDISYKISKTERTLYFWGNIFSIIFIIFSIITIFIIISNGYSFHLLFENLPLIIIFTLSSFLLYMFSFTLTIYINKIKKPFIL